MWAQLPPGVWVAALVTILYTFVCLLANVVMLWLAWMFKERLSYIAIIGYLTLLCTICSIVQQMYEYEHWEEFMWDQHHYIQDHPDDANAWFNNGNFGFRLVLSNIRLFTNDATAALTLSFSISIAGTVYNFWAARHRAENVFNLLGKIFPILLAALSVCLLQVPAVQRNWTAYMIIANGLSVISCALSFVFFVAIVTEYVRAKRTVERWRGWLRYKARGVVSWLQSDRSRERHRRRQPDSDTYQSNAENVTTNASWARMSLSTHSIYDSWLVIRLLMLSLMLWVFIIVTLVTHIQEKDHVVTNAKNPTPNLTASYANDAILGYMPAVTPGLLLFIVFGTTKTLRQTMYETFVPRSLRKRRQQRHSTQHVQLQTLSSQQSTYLPNAMERQEPGPHGSVNEHLEDLTRKASTSSDLPKVVTTDIKVGDSAKGTEISRSRMRALSRESRPGRGDLPHSSLIEEDD